MVCHTEPSGEALQGIVWKNVKHFQKILCRCLDEPSLYWCLTTTNQINSRNAPLQIKLLQRPVKEQKHPGAAIVVSKWKSKPVVVSLTGCHIQTMPQARSLKPEKMDLWCQVIWQSQLSLKVKPSSILMLSATVPSATDTPHCKSCLCKLICNHAA